MQARIEVSTQKSSSKSTSKTPILTIAQARKAGIPLPIVRKPGNSSVTKSSSNVVQFPSPEPAEQDLMEAALEHPAKLKDIVMLGEMMLRFANIVGQIERGVQECKLRLDRAAL